MTPGRRRRAPVRRLGRGIWHLRLLSGAARRVKHSPYGTVGTCYRGRQLEVVWVAKRGEPVDPGWYSQPDTDFIVVLEGRLKLELPSGSSCVLRPGDLLVLRAGARARAYSFPRHPPSSAVFLAFHAKRPRSRHRRR